MKIIWAKQIKSYYAFLIIYKGGKHKMIFRKDLTNQTYGFWTVLEFDQERSDKEKRTYWKC